MGRGKKKKEGFLDIVFGNSGRRPNSGGTTGSRKQRSGPGKNAKHGDGGNHSQKSKGNPKPKGQKNRR